MSDQPILQCLLLNRRLLYTVAHWLLLYSVAVVAATAAAAAAPTETVKAAASIDGVEFEREFSTCVTQLLQCIGRKIIHNPVRLLPNISVDIGFAVVI